MHDPCHAQLLGSRPLGTPSHHPQPGIPQATAAPPKPAVRNDDMEPIGLDDDGSMLHDAASTDPLVANAAEAMKNIPKKFTAFGVSAAAQSAHSWKRQPTATGHGICRVRTFHGRLSDQGLEFLDTTINEWLDGHPEIEVKAVTTNANMFDGKVKEMTGDATDNASLESEGRMQQDKGELQENKGEVEGAMGNDV